MDKDAYFIPAGYDSLPLLKNNDISYDLAKLYEERIPYTKPKNIVREEEIICEDISAFLSKFNKRKAIDATSETKIKEEEPLNVQEVISSSPLKQQSRPDFNIFKGPCNSKGFNTEFNSNMTVKEETEKKDIVKFI
jgi:hypothetical protein